MHVPFSATGGRRSYNRWVANETMEDFTLRFTARRARRWSHARVANTALGSISFLALEAIGGAITLTYGFDAAIIAIMLVGAVLFLTGLPISYYAARYGVDIDLLTRGAGFGYIGSTVTSLIYASFTFIFFALEAAILALALELCFGIPVTLGYILSALVVIPLVVNGFSKISAFQTWTQPFWVVLHLMPFVLLAWAGTDLSGWTGYEGVDGKDGATILMIGAASGVALSLIAQIGEQVDFLRFLPEPKTAAERRRWWAALLAAGPGWSVLGVTKMLAGSFLVTLAVGAAVPPKDATDPTRMYHTAFEQVLSSPGLALALTGGFVILSQLKINVTNAYAGSIAWSNFFSRLTHSHPGRVVWLVFNVAIALMLMELGVFGALEHILGLYSHVALAWIGALTADLVINKPLGLSPRGIEFRRAHLYDVNPVGIGAMGGAVILSFVAHSGIMGEVAQALSAFIALATAFVMAPVIARATGGQFYIARPAAEAAPAADTGRSATCACSICEYRFDPEDMTHCPFYAGPICSLCCTLDSSCRDSCKPHGRFDAMVVRTLHAALPGPLARALMSRLSVFLIGTTIPAAIFGGLLLLIRAHADSPDLDAVLTVIFCTALVVIGVIAWTLILAIESQHKARDEADLQTQRLVREIRAHDRTDAALQRAKEKAEAANLAKTRYMAGISHELRTPLNAIYGFAQVLENDPALPAGRRDAVRTIRRGSEHLAGLIENLLDISKIEAGRLDIYRDRINLPILLRHVTEIFEAPAREKGLDFGIRTSGNLPEWIDFDEKRLRQIIINLLSNAIRYTEKGSVSLNLHYRNEVAVIEVCDTGIGIAADQLDRIWKPFERLSAKGGSGTGLGLTITRLLVDILGGEITVESTPGEGTTFRVRLMLPSVMPEADQPRAASAAPERLKARGYLGPRKTIMAVDDDLDHLRLLDTALKPIGFLVQTVPDAETALDILDDCAPDLFVLDIDMPGMDGWQLARRLRDRPEYRSTPIVMVTGHALEARMPVDREGLYDAFVVKPYSLRDVLVRLADLMKIELVFEDPFAAEAAPGARPRPPARPEVLTRLKSLAGIGHAAGVRRELDALEEARALEPDALARLRDRLAEFDMAGLQRLVEEMTRDAA
ncbi:hybrid sensor histidine kinase/response regulator [Rhodovulum marinum]|uniref:histidine kinase n=1 Tax=Rhodovulum marinum TaxID=320662 RepID=A0A4R2Q682_9RHOB|nr:ATP-binding protein [Rhodovulum marinum]TCP42195.1 signal transduction histidine kinase [Rhodovulum marinum]